MADSVASRLHALVLRLRWPWLVALVIYGALGLTFLRGDFGTTPGVLPQGTNALNTYTLFAFQQHHPFSVWLAPYTDWGQPVNTYPGVDPQNLVAISGGINPTEYIRTVEFLSFLTSGLTMCWAAGQLGGTRSAALVAGVFYELMAEVPHFFEGHVATMVTLALAPLLIGLTLRWFERPKLWPGLALAVVVYLCVSVGDLGSLYRLLFFASLLALGLIAYRLVNQPYSRREIGTIALCTTTLVVLLLPWLLTYLGGVRPEFTTAVVTSIRPFGRTNGQSLFLSFTGFAGDDSFSALYLHSPTYAFDDAQTQYLFAIVPGIVGVYAIGFGRLRERLLYASGLVAMVVSTGPLYPSLSVFNRVLFNHVPLFDTDPVLFHWNVYYILVVGLLLGVSLSKLTRWLETSIASGFRVAPGRPVTGPDADPTGRIPASGPPNQRRAGTPRFSRRSAGVIATAAVLLLVASLPTLQNWEAFSEPPGVFEFPANYTAGYAYVTNQPAVGGVLSVPFGNIYERTPWGGVSASSELVAGTSTNRNLAIFEAGTPQSLAIDRVVGDGLAEFDTNNLTKLLNATGVEYVVTTDYPDWYYASDPAYYPPTSYRGTTAQLGLGSSVFHSGVQSVYRIPEPAGNVSVFHQYFVYDGGESLLFELLNQPWYQAADGLVCLCDVPESEQALVLQHASGFVTDPNDVENLSAGAWQELTRGSVPFGLIIGADDYNSSSVRQYLVPWNSSNGKAVGTVNSSAPATTVDFLDALTDHGFSHAQASVRASSPPSALFSLEPIGGSAVNVSLGPPLASTVGLDYWTRSITSAGINNQGKYPYNGTVAFIAQNGTEYLDWRFAGHNSTYQYLNFELHDLSGLSGISITVRTPVSEPTDAVAQFLFNGTEVSVPSYASNVSPAGRSLTYSFYFPDATGPGTDTFLSHLGNITRFVIGYPRTGSQSEIWVSNLTGFSSPTSGFTWSSLGTLDLSSAPAFQFITTPFARIDTLVLWSGGTPRAALPRQDVYAPQPDLTDESFTLNGSGWALVQIPQVYSSLWQLDGPVQTSDHLTMDIGLNGWLVNTTGPVSLRIVYQGVPLLLRANIAEGVGLCLIGLVLVVIDRRERRTEYETRSQGQNTPARTEGSSRREGPGRGG